MPFFPEMPVDKTVVPNTFIPGLSSADIHKAMQGRRCSSNSNNHAAYDPFCHSIKGTSLGYKYFGFSFQPSAAILMDTIWEFDWGSDTHPSCPHKARSNAPCSDRIAEPKELPFTFRRRTGIIRLQITQSMEPGFNTQR